MSELTSPRTEAEDHRWAQMMILGFRQRRHPRKKQAFSSVENLLLFNQLVGYNV